MRIFWAFALPSASCLSCATVAGGQKCSLLVRHSRKTAAILSNEHLTVPKISTTAEGDSDIPMAVRTVEADAIAALDSDGKSLGELRSSRKAFNGGVISVLLLAAAYCVLRSDLDAIISLYLTPDWAIPEVASSRAEICIQLLARLPGDWLQWYDASALSRPLVTKACTSAVCYYAGDIVGQLSTGRTLASLDLGRSGRSAAAGFIGHGPVAHYWLQFVDEQLSFGGAWWALPVKIAADQARPGRPRQ